MVLIRSGYRSDGCGFPFNEGQTIQKECLLNAWIVITWSDWKYGRYSARALTQSYPVFAFGLACSLD